jgi:hypothetical protein
MSYTPTDSVRDDFSSLLTTSGGSSTAGIVASIMERSKAMVKDGLLKTPKQVTVNFIDYPGTESGYKLDAAVVAVTYALGNGVATTHAMVMVPGLSREEMRVVSEDRRLRYEFTAVPYDLLCDDVDDRRSRRGRDRDEDVVDQPEVAARASEYTTKLAAHLAANIDGAGSVKVAGFLTIPYGYRPREEDLTRQITKVVDDLKMSLHEELSAGGSYDRYRIVKEDEVLNGQVVYATEDGIDIFGNPIRRNLHLKVTKARRNSRDGDSRNLLSSNTSADLGSVDAFVDYIPLREVTRRRGRNRRRDEDFEGCYGLALNIVNLSSGGYNLLEAQQMVLQAVVAMTRESTMVRAMYPVGSAKVLRTAEALNVETADYELGFEGNPSLEEWEDMNDIVVREDSLHVNLFIERGGLLSRVQQTIRDACDARNPEVYREAFAAMVVAADRATDDAFSRCFDESRDEIGYITPRIVPLGTFTDANGQLRDLREFDRFYVMSELGLRKRDVSALRIFDRICNDPEMGDDERRERIEHVLDAALGRNNYTLTSFADVVELSPAYLEALADAYHDVGLSIATDGIEEKDDREYYYRSRDGYGTSGFAERSRYYAPRRSRDDRR